MAEHEPSIGATSEWFTPPEYFEGPRTSPSHGENRGSSREQSQRGSPYSIALFRMAIYSLRPMQTEVTDIHGNVRNSRKPNRR